MCSALKSVSGRSAAGPELHAVDAYRRRPGKSWCSFILGSSWMRVVSFTLRPLYSLDTVLDICWIGGWAGRKKGKEKERRASEPVMRKIPVPPSHFVD